jgi:hypothetical protein
VLVTLNGSWAQLRRCRIEKAGSLAPAGGAARKSQQSVESTSALPTSAARLDPDGRRALLDYVPKPNVPCDHKTGQSHLKSRACPMFAHPNFASPWFRWLMSNVMLLLLPL